MKRLQVLALVLLASIVAAAQCTPNPPLAACGYTSIVNSVTMGTNPPTTPALNVPYVDADFASLGSTSRMVRITADGLIVENQHKAFGSLGATGALAWSKDEGTNTRTFMIQNGWGGRFFMRLDKRGFTALPLHCNFTSYFGSGNFWNNWCGNATIGGGFPNAGTQALVVSNLEPVELNFSAKTPNVIYGMGGHPFSSEYALWKVDISPTIADPTQTPRLLDLAGNSSVTYILDPVNGGGSAGVKCLPSAPATITTNGFRISANDRTFTIVLETVPTSGVHWLMNYDSQAGHCYAYDSLTNNLYTDGANPVQVSWYRKDGTTALPAPPAWYSHGETQGINGIYAALSTTDDAGSIPNLTAWNAWKANWCPGGGCNDLFMWPNYAQAKMYVCEECDGHAASGWDRRIQFQTNWYAYNPAQPSIAAAYDYGLVANNDGSFDQHGDMNGAYSRGAGGAYICGVGTTQAGVTGHWANPGNALLSTPAPLRDEAFCKATNASASQNTTLWRLGRVYTSRPNDFLAGYSSQSDDGLYMLLNTDFNGQLGDATTGAACTTWGSCREDVWLVELAPGGKTVVVIGDSIAEGHTGAHGRLHTGGAFPNQTFDLTLPNQTGSPAYYLASLLGPTYSTINQGIGSTTTQQTMDRWGRDALANGSSGGDVIGATPTLTRKADFVWLHAGVNDSFWSDEAGVESRLSTIISSARANSIPIIVDTIGNLNNWMPCTSSQPSAYTNLVNINNWLKATYGTTGANGVLIADYQAFTSTGAAFPWCQNSYISADNIHPTAAGYQAWTQSVYNLVQTTNFFASGAQTLSSCSVAPASASIQAGAQQSYSITCNFINPTSSANCTASSGLSSSNIAVATTSGQTATGVGAGNATITASTGGVQCTSALTVTGGGPPPGPFMQFFNKLAGQVLR